MPVSASSDLYRLANFWGFTAFAVSLGSSYFQVWTEGGSAGGLWGYWKRCERALRVGAHTSRCERKGVRWTDCGGTGKGVRGGAVRFGDSVSESLMSGACHSSGWGGCGGEAFGR